MEHDRIHLEIFSKNLGNEDNLRLKEDILLAEVYDYSEIASFCWYYSSTCGGVKRCKVEEEKNCIYVALLCPVLMPADCLLELRYDFLRRLKAECVSKGTWYDIAKKDGNKEE